MKNILIVLPNDSLGGAEQYLKMIAEYFYNMDYVIYVFFFEKKITNNWESFESNQCKLFYTSAQNKKTSLLLLLLKFIQNRKIYFEYAFTSHLFYSSLIGFLRNLNLLKINNFVARESTSIFKRYFGIDIFRYKIYYQLGYSSINLLICQTEYMKNQLIAELPWLDKKIKIKVIPNPVDLAAMSLKAQDRHALNINAPFIVSAGRLISEKGFDILIKAFALLKHNYKNFKLVILGAGEQRNELVYIINNLEISNDVILYGFTDNVYPFFKKAKLCVVSSRIEGFPNILLQMMSQNEKVVSTLCAGGIEQIQGLFTCPVNDENALFSKINECLQANTNECRYFFDNELKERSINKFVDKVNLYLAPSFL